MSTSVHKKEIIKEYEIEQMLANYMADKMKSDFYNHPAKVEQRMLEIEEDIKKEVRKNSEAIVIHVMVHARNSLAHFLGKELWPEVEAEPNEESALLQQKACK